MGSKVDTSSPKGSCMYTFGSSLVTTENKAVAGARELMVSRQAVGRSSRKHVDPSRVARRCGIGAVAAACSAVSCAFWLCSASVRWWTEARTATLAANSEQLSRWNTTATMGGFGDCERSTAISQTARKPLAKRTDSASAADFSAIGNDEPFRSGKRVRA